MKIPDRSFLKFAGAEPARVMRKKQLQAEAAYVSGLTYEKPLDSPDRPSNIERKAQESLATGLPDSDNPSKIMAQASSFRAPYPEGEEPGVVKDSPDNPSTILKANSEPGPLVDPAPLPPEADLPGAITKALGEFKPPESDPGPLPPEVDTPSKILESLAQTQVEEPRQKPIEADTPIAILDSLSKQRPEEYAAQPLEPDVPSTMLASLRQNRPPEKAPDTIHEDLPVTILAPLGQSAPEPTPGPKAGDLPVELRAVPESSGGRIISEEA